MSQLLTDNDEVSFFYVQYYQLLCDFEMELIPHTMLLNNPSDSLVNFIAANSEFQIALVMKFP